MKTQYKLYDTKERSLLGIFNSLCEVREKMEEITGNKIRLNYKYANQGAYDRRYLTFVVRNI